jgi:copper(I)-binding protein
VKPSKSLACAIALAACLSLRAGYGQVSDGVAKVDFLAGDVGVSAQDGTKRSVAVGGYLRAGDTVDTAKNGELHAVIADGGYIAVRPNSKFILETVSAKGGEDDQMLFSLARGALRAVTGWVSKVSPRAYAVRAGTVTIGVRGTDHEVVVILRDEAQPGEQAGTHGRVNEGRIVMMQEARELEVPAGRAAVAAADGTAPRLHEGIPALFERRRTANDGRVDQHSREISRHMENSLRERGLLRQGEGAEKFIERRRGEVERARRTRVEREERREPERHPRPRRPL